MKHNRFAFLIIVLLAATGCQNVPLPDSRLASAGTIQNASWNGMHLDVVQFVAEEKGFSCLAPSGVSFTKEGDAVKKTLCFKTENGQTSTRILYLDAHSMMVTSTTQSTEAEARPIKK